MRHIAVERITDQQVLFKVVLNDADREVRQASVERIADQNILARVARDAADWTVRQVAVSKLTNRSLLARIAQEDLNEYVRMAASQALWEIRRSDFQQLDEDSLGVLAQEAKDPTGIPQSPKVLRYRSTIAKLYRNQVLLFQWKSTTQKCRFLF